MGKTSHCPSESSIQLPYRAILFADLLRAQHAQDVPAATRRAQRQTARASIKQAARRLQALAMSMQCMQQLMCASPALRESALLLGACMDEGDDLFATLEALAELEPGQAGGDSVMQAFEGPVLKGPAMSASLAPADQTEVTADRYRLNGQSRLRWSAHLHALFQACVEQLGGPAAATPAAIQRLVRLQSMPTARANLCCWCCCSTASNQGIALLRSRCPAHVRWRCQGCPSSTSRATCSATAASAANPAMQPGGLGGQHKRLPCIPFKVLFQRATCCHLDR